MQMQPQTHGITRAQCMLFGTYICGAAMAGMLVAALLEAPGAAFVTIAGVGLLGTLGMVCIKSR